MPDAVSVCGVPDAPGTLDMPGEQDAASAEGGPGRLACWRGLAGRARMLQPPGERGAKCVATMSGKHKRFLRRKKTRPPEKHSSRRKEAGVSMTQHQKRPVESEDRDELLFLDFSDRFFFPSLPASPPPGKIQTALR